MEKEDVIFALIVSFRRVKAVRPPEALILSPPEKPLVSAESPIQMAIALHTYSLFRCSSARFVCGVLILNALLSGCASLITARVNSFQQWPASSSSRTVFESNATHEGSLFPLPSVVPYLVRAIFEGFPGANGRVRMVRFKADTGEVIRQ